MVRVKWVMVWVLVLSVFIGTCAFAWHTMREPLEAHVLVEVQPQWTQPIYWPPVVVVGEI